MSSELKLHVAENRKQNSAVIDVFEALTRDQRRCSSPHHDVFAQWRTVLEACAEIGSDAVANRKLKEQQFQWLGAVETQIVRIDERAKLRRHIEVRAQIKNVNPRIYEIRLSRRWR